mmetsp:Transcript_35157/g.71114  ORF Transcript_35157/g.71114 Transcript_35157/m.71114 type:complete len:88 (+) Transcript_35157:217-480(+)
MYAGEKTGSVPNAARKGSGNRSDKSEDIGRANSIIKVKMKAARESTCIALRQDCALRVIRGTLCFPFNWGIRDIPWHMKNTFRDIVA